MGNRSRLDRKQGALPKGPPAPRTVPSLLDAMRDGYEYGSIVALVPEKGDLVPELRRALGELEVIRGRPCVCYLANVVRDGLAETAITSNDHLPFDEMIARVPTSSKELDIFLVTPGGSAHQVTLFLQALRPRFDRVEFILPYKCMSAGTLWALSGDEIWMDSRGCMGPIDPQVPSGGRYVPAQSLLELFDEVGRQGAAAVNAGGSVPWNLVRLVDTLDRKELADAFTSSQYAINMAAELLAKYKFRSWTKHKSSELPVTDMERVQRAKEVADLLCSHTRWRAHGHAITRDIADTEVKIRVQHPETVPGMERAIRRLWALAHYVFDRGPNAKIMLSADYQFVRTVQQ